MLSLFIDADGCPVKEETYKVAVRYQLKVFVVANKRMHIPLSHLIQMEVVGADADEADNWIVDHIGENDICITSDIPLADRCLKKNARVLSTRGEEFDEDMIGSAVAMRELLKGLRDAGEIVGGPKPMEKKDHSKFLDNLDRIIQSIKRKSSK